MHLGDSGFLPMMEGSALDELISPSMRKSGSLHSNFIEIVGEIRSEYDKQKTPLSHRIYGLKIAHFHKSDDWSTLTCKASHARALLPILVPILHKFNDGSDHNGHRILAFEALNSCYQIILRSGTFIPPKDCETMAENIETCMFHYNWLTNYSLERHSLRYNLTLKAHLLVHLVGFSRYINPRKHWAYSFEAMMGVIAKSAFACVPGTSLIQAGAKVADNYRLAFYMKANRRRG